MGSVSGSDNATVSSSSTVSSPFAQPHTSPVPYLFGGLAAVLCIIMFSLLMLAFSYRRHSARQAGMAQMELAIGALKQNESGVAESLNACEQKILVILAGEEHPTYLATPICSKCSSSLEDGLTEKGDENRQNTQKSTEKQMSDDHVATPSTTPPENGGAPESHQHNQ